MKFRQRIKNLSIKKKIIFYSYVVLIPILMIISGIMVGRNYVRARQELMARGQNRVQNLENSLAELNRNLSELSVYICINNDISELLTAADAAEKNKNSQLWLDEAPMRFIQDTLALKGYIKTLGIYPENGIMPYLKCLDSSAQLAALEDVHQTEMYRTAVGRKGAKSWKRINKNQSEVYWANPGEKIVLYREIFDLSKQKALGYLVIGADAGKYDALCEDALEDTQESVLLLNEEGEPLVRTGQAASWTEEGFGEEVLQGFANRESGYMEYQNQFLFFQRNAETKQSTCILIPGSIIMEGIRSIAYTPILMLLGILIGLFPVLIFVSNIVTKPLEKVTFAMSEFRKGDFEQYVEVDTLDEVGEVAVCFNKMVRDLKQLIDEKYVMELREKESELTALQAQINPHFLYNTLDTLYWQAMGADNEEIAENILALSNLFRQVLGTGKGVTTVGQECELVREYLTIQKMRFTKRLEYEISVEPEVKDIPIPKLILQPFVENAVVHGIENAENSSKISVSAARIPQGIEFVVEDTGVGMSKQQLESVLDMEDSEKYRGQRIGRYAIRNVRERLTLMYHNDFEMKLESELGKGTRVTLRIFGEKVRRKDGNEKTVDS
ncbi:MAG: histidine kinase [Lachnospiraceae bacterium]|nr:histidine kinase [Lachnospiraceae bacterium]